MYQYLVKTQQPNLDKLDWTGTKQHHTCNEIHVFQVASTAAQM